MNMTDVITETISKHKDEEILDFLASKLTGINHEMQSAIKNNNPAIAYSLAGDIGEVANILKSMAKRNKEKALAIQQQSSI